MQRHAPNFLFVGEGAQRGVSHVLLDRISPPSVSPSSLSPASRRGAFSYDCSCTESLALEPIDLLEFVHQQFLESSALLSSLSSADSKGKESPPQRKHNDNDNDNDHDPYWSWCEKQHASSPRGDLDEGEAAVAILDAYDEKISQPRGGFLVEYDDWRFFPTRWFDFVVVVRQEAPPSPNHRPNRSCNFSLEEISANYSDQGIFEWTLGDSVEPLALEFTRLLCRFHCAQRPPPLPPLPFPKEPSSIESPTKAPDGFRAPPSRAPPPSPPPPPPSPGPDLSSSPLKKKRKKKKKTVESSKGSTSSPSLSPSHLPPSPPPSPPPAENIPPPPPLPSTSKKKRRKEKAIANEALQEKEKLPPKPPHEHEKTRENGEAPKTLEKAKEKEKGKEKEKEKEKGNDKEKEKEKRKQKQRDEKQKEILIPKAPSPLASSQLNSLSHEKKGLSKKKSKAIASLGEAVPLLPPPSLSDHDKENSLPVPLPSPSPPPSSRPKKPLPPRVTKNVAVATDSSFLANLSHQAKTKALKSEKALVAQSVLFREKEKALQKQVEQLRADALLSSQEKKELEDKWALERSEWKEERQSLLAQIDRLSEEHSRSQLTSLSEQQSLQREIDSLREEVASLKEDLSVSLENICFVWTRLEEILLPESPTRPVLPTDQALAVRKVLCGLLNRLVHYDPPSSLRLS